jgi:multiple sugar transport system permease protein
MTAAIPAERSSSSVGLMFCSPWIVGVILLFAWPFAASLYWSFCKFDIINPPEFVGLENYSRIADEVATGRGAGRAILNTLYYSLLSVPLSVVLGVSLAVLLSAKVKGQSFFRTLVFLPSIIPIVASSILWVWMLDTDTGLVNTILGWIGFPPQNWLNQARSAVSLEGAAQIGAWFSDGRLLLFGSKDALVLMTLWGVGNFVVIYLAAIGDIPNTLYEAAEIDGAGWYRKFLHVTVPMLSPVIFFNLVMGLIRSVQNFTNIYILSEGTGQPGDSLTTISLKLFLSAFADFEMGYASALAWMLFVGLVVATLLLARLSKNWVHYRGI